MRRHAGVLGLSACILSSPYDVPIWMPQLLMDLSAHLNDTQPIEVCVVAYFPKDNGAVGLFFSLLSTKPVQCQVFTGIFFC